MTTETLNNIVNTIIIPCVEIGFPIALIFAIVGKIINFIISCITGDKKVNL